jgi:hypothetical protein
MIDAKLAYFVEKREGGSFPQLEKAPPQYFP